jgi:hypothetical protein
MSRLLSSSYMDTPLREPIVRAAIACMGRRFRSTDPIQFSKNGSEKAIKNFLISNEPILEMMPKTRQEICQEVGMKNWTQLLMFGTEEMLRGAVATIIKDFKA